MEGTWRAQGIVAKRNGEEIRVEVEPRTLLGVHMLRDSLRLTGTHIGCVGGTGCVVGRDWC